MGRRRYEKVIVLMGISNAGSVISVVITTCINFGLGAYQVRSDAH